MCLLNFSFDKLFVLSGCFVILAQTQLFGSGFWVFYGYVECPGLFIDHLNQYSFSMHCHDDYSPLLSVLISLERSEICVNTFSIPSLSIILMPFADTLSRTKRL